MKNIIDKTNKNESFFSNQKNQSILECGSKIAMQSIQYLKQKSIYHDLCFKKRFNQTLENKTLLALLNQNVNSDFIHFIQTSKYIADFVPFILRNNTISWKTFMYTLQTDLFNISLTISFPLLEKQKQANMNKIKNEIIVTVSFTLLCVQQVIEMNDKVKKGAKNKKQINLVCLLIDQKRDIPPSSFSFGTNNINAGVTSTYNGTSDILVYRKQHVHKVIIHELIHASGIDMGFNTDPNTEKRIEVMEKNVKRSLNYNMASTKLLNCNETFTEILACFWNIYLYRFLHNVKDSYDTLWKKEYKTYQKTCRLILNHFDLRNRVRLEKEKNNNLDSNHVHETSHLFSYFIAKCALWPFLDQIPICLGNEKNNEENIRIFITLYEEKCLDPQFWSSLLTQKGKENGKKKFVMTNFS